MTPDEITLISCNYKTPDEMELMRRSLLASSEKMGAATFMLVENSPDGEGARRWREFGWPFLDNRDGDTRHAYALNRAVKEAGTRFALVVDSDVQFLEDPWPILERWAEDGVVLGGCIMSDVPQDGEIIHLMPRVKPWFCFIDLDFLRANGLPFHDTARERKGSDIIYGHSPIVDVKDLHERGNSAASPWYDVGATLLEDVRRLGGKVADEDHEGIVFRHFGAMSYLGQGSKRAEVRKALHAFRGPFKPVSLKVATRYHHGRETLLKRLLRSLDGQPVEIVSSYVTDEEREELERNGVRRLVKVRPNVKYEFNGYINDLAREVGDAFMWVLDSDDLAYPNAVRNILDAPLDFSAVNLFSIHYTPQKMRLPLLSNTYGSGLTISSQCLVWNPYFVETKWRDDCYAADNEFLAQAMRDGYKRIWHSSVPEVAWLDFNRNGSS